MSNDIKIATLRKNIETRRKKLGAKPSISYSGNGTVVSPVLSAALNLNVLTATACSVLVGEFDSAKTKYKEGCSIIGITPDSKYLDSLESDLQDTVIRGKQIAWLEQDKELRRMDSQLAEMLSADAKTSNALADFESKLG